ncbi:MAG: 16S rRNA (adenine(1518)-N(6)/adenine(1519)-N(6))-dimethyltransferase RsmA [Bacteroidales bacterium]|nr:16S rRNA (adenine(1518)-N(6)/adenine(1519)-N(6))-dimethyltransferase RsmA [Bacteroidales bacterium]MCF8456127.1 16S rRNA (adenine(1518)-N(6)/adenine(1519)-N(6))-dimethyltransferase RsmA [Bacteroidales bacterium]
MVRAKKSLGQHFLNDKNIAQKIVELLSETENPNVLEIGPGTGVLTQFLLQKEGLNFKQIEIDTESVEYLLATFPQLKNENLIIGNFLKIDLTTIFTGPFAIIGNFPYNISTQILFKVLDNRNLVPEVVGMFQKEVAERIASIHGNKTYGIMSVLLQTFYQIEYCFTVSETVFTPPPKVKSAVLKLTRNQKQELACNERFFFTVVKQAFGQRRKTLRNSLKSILVNLPVHQEVFGKRPEQLSVSDFESLTCMIEELKSKHIEN